MKAQCHENNKSNDNEETLRKYQCNKGLLINVNGNNNEGTLTIQKTRWQ